MNVRARVARHRWLVLLALLALTAALVAVLVWPDPPRQPTGYRDFDVCLLTPETGLADPQAATVWAAAREVSVPRRVRLSYQPVAGEQTTARAVEYLASLVAQECDVIVAVGLLPVVAVTAYQGGHPGSTIVAVGREIDDASDDSLASSTMDVLVSLLPEA